MSATLNDEHVCPICLKPFEPADLCASDIEMGICHAACLHGSPTVNLDTGEPVGGPIPTYRYDEGDCLSQPQAGEPVVGADKQPYPLANQLQAGLDKLRAAASRGALSSREVFTLTDPLMDLIFRAAQEDHRHSALSQPHPAPTGQAVAADPETLKARAASVLCEAGALCGWPAPNCNAREGAEALFKAGLLSQPHPADERVVETQPALAVKGADIEDMAWNCDQWPAWLHSIVDRTNEVADRLDMSSEQAHAYAVLSALSTAPATADGWRTMDDAPKDTRIWACGDNWHWRDGAVAVLHSDYNGHKDVVTMNGIAGTPFRINSKDSPTHWLALPAAPTATGGR